MPKYQGYSSNLHPKRQSTGLRPLIVLSIVSVLLLTFYLREGDAGPIHTLRSGVDDRHHAGAPSGAAPWRRPSTRSATSLATSPRRARPSTSSRRRTPSSPRVWPSFLRPRPLPSASRAFWACSPPITSSPRLPVSSASRPTRGARPSRSTRALPTGSPSTCRSPTLPA